MSAIIREGKDNIEIKNPEDLETGDYIALRESNRDIIKDIADNILEKNSLSNLRELSQRWKEPLVQMNDDLGIDAVHTKLKSAGLIMTKQTIQGWINGQRIIPRDLSSIEKIANVTNDIFLKENAMVVYEAGKTVTEAHRKAGVYLTKKLKYSLPSYINTSGEMSPEDLQEPFNLELDDVGNVLILKVIEIGEKIQLDTININRLIKEI